MASKRPHGPRVVTFPSSFLTSIFLGLRLLAYPRYCREYIGQSQSCSTVCIYGAQFFYILQASQVSLFMF